MPKFNDMADIKERIKNIKPYFRKMEVETDNEGSIIYVSVVFPKNWVVADDIPEKYNVTVQRNQAEIGGYYFCAEIEEGFDAVFDAIDYNIAKMKAAIERASLLTQKVTELRELFEDESIPLSTLRSIDFKMYGIKPEQFHGEEEASEPEQPKEVKTNKRTKKQV